jgi:hypothetical protein
VGWRDVPFCVENDHDGRVNTTNKFSGGRGCAGTMQRDDGSLAEAGFCESVL